jgi:SAM-dependent methyltransferase
MAGFHDDRLEMLDSVLAPEFERKWMDASCLDIGCNQGFFAMKMAEKGCRQVMGIDIRDENIEDARLIHQLYDLPNLGFQTADLYDLTAENTGRFDVVLMLSVLFLLENPIEAIRIARELTKRMIIIETPVAPELKGQIDWGSSKLQKQLQGSFSLIDQSAEMHTPVCSTTGLSLCPGRETLMWLMKRMGFSRVEIVEPPPNAYEQLSSGKRVMVAGYV